MTRTDAIIEATNNFFDVAKKSNTAILEEIKSYLLTIVQNGKLSLTNKEINQIALEVQQAIIETIRRGEYYSAVNVYKSTLSEIERIIINQYADFVGVSVEEVVFSNPFRERVLNSLENHLRGQAWLIDIISPIRDVVVRQALLGTTYRQAIKTIEDYIDKNGLSKKLKNINSGQVGRDILNQYDGAIQNEIRKDFEFDAFYFIGGLVEDSRPVCAKLTEKDVWTLDELQVVLDEYCPNGVPSKDYIVYTTIPEEGGGVVTKRGRKGGGMIEGTSVENFGIVRGGYNCLHEVVFTYQ